MDQDDANIGSRQFKSGLAPSSFVNVVLVMADENHLVKSLGPDAAHDVAVVTAGRRTSRETHCHGNVTVRGGDAAISLYLVLGRERVRREQMRATRSGAIPISFGRESQPRPIPPPAPSLLAAVSPGTTPAQASSIGLSTQAPASRQ
ncbi:uncharacterized protein PG986_014670 [Apiospora aurea]|uniref:Uncharacterized protein n=1 Tax=Apiospora aurea TaxID=335848 RepID=A0ABR1PTN5_9PEZI